MNRSEQINELTKALAKAQAEMQNPAFDSMNPHFRNKFASLASVRNAVIPVLSKFGLTLTQELTNGERGPKVTTLVAHESGQWIEYGPLEMPVSKADAQGVGSSVTYARRYCLMAVCGVVGDEDDDGNEASKKGPLAKAINPRDGFMDGLDEAARLRVLDMAIEVKDAWTAGDLGTAFKAHARHHKSLETAEEQIALWDQYDSKLRSALTKRLEEVKAAKKAAELGSQA